MSTLHITTQRVMSLVEHYTTNCIDGIRTKKEFFERAKLPYTTLSRLNKGEVIFTVEQLQSVGSTFGVSMDWLFGFSAKMMRETKDSLTPLQQIEMAVKELKMSSK